MQPSGKSGIRTRLSIIMAAVLVVAAGAVLAFTGVIPLFGSAAATNAPSSTAAQATATPSPTAVSEKQGNLPGNIVNGGIAVKDGEWTYTIGQGGSIYREKAGGSEKSRLSAKHCGWLNVSDGWIYYVDLDDNGALYRMKTDGSGSAELHAGYCSYPYIEGDWVYFVQGSGTDGSENTRIARMKPDGTALSVLYDPEASFSRDRVGGTPVMLFDGGWIYFVEYAQTSGDDDGYEYYIKKMKPDGTGMQTLAERKGNTNGFYSLMVFEGNLFYLEEGFDSCSLGYIDRSGEDNDLSMEIANYTHAIGALGALASAQINADDEYLYLFIHPHYESQQQDPGAEIVAVDKSFNMARLKTGVQVELNSIAGGTLYYTYTDTSTEEGTTQYGSLNLADAMNGANAVTPPVEIIKDSDSRNITDKDLEGRTQWEVLLARDEIYARHGLTFNDPEIREYFENVGWYTPDAALSVQEIKLNAFEEANVQFIEAYEKAHGWS